MPPEQSNAPLAMLSMLSSKVGEGAGLASDLLGVKSSAALFIGILRSRSAQNSLVSKFDLRKVYWVKRWEDARHKLEDRTTLSEDRKSGIITISVTDRDPNRAAALNQAYIDQLNILVSQLNTSAAHKERMFLETRLAAVKQELDTAATDFSRFASKNTAIDITEQGKAMVQSAAQLQGEMIAAQSELSGIEQIYSPSSVRARALKARISELQRQQEKLRGADLTDGEASETSSYPSLRKLPLLGVSYFDLYRRVKIQETVYESLTRQYEMAKVQEAKEIPTVRVLDAPDIAERKSFPPRILVIIFGTFLFFLGACGWVIAQDSWQQLPNEDFRKLMLSQVCRDIGLADRRTFHREPR
jgi:capsule polysaccharide export protein KpsE/RkpR